MAVCKISELKLPKTGILVKHMEFGTQTSKGGIIHLDDDMKDVGIRPRWCRVVKIGSNIDLISVDDYVLVDHGRWTHGMTMTDDNGADVIVRFIDHKDVLIKTPTPPEEYILSSKK